MSDYISVRGALDTRSGWRGASIINGTPVIISPALPSFPTFHEDLYRGIRHALKNHCTVCAAALRNYDPTHAVSAGNKIIVSAELFERLKDEAAT